MKVRAPDFPSYGFVVSNPEKLVIRDLGPWSRHKTITNAIEEVVARLFAEGRLPRDRRLFYIDSEGFPTEAKHDGAGGFDCFAPATAGDVR